MVEGFFKQGLISSEVIKLSENELLYKGFKLIKNGDEYSILDIRKFDHYSPVKDRDLIILENEGFVRGCDLILYNRDIHRIQVCNDAIIRKTLLKKGYKEKLHEDPRGYKKKIGICERQNEELIVLLRFYESRSSQLKKKLGI